MSTISHDLARELQDLDLKIHKDYEGRCMFGRICFGIVVHDFNELADIALDLSEDVRDEFREVLDNLRKDNMGWDYIAYFPAYQWPEDLF